MEGGDKNGKEWSIEELKLLAKAVLKFPIGIQNRYTKIIEFMETKRTEKEIIKQIKKMSETKIDTKQFVVVENRNTRKGINLDSGPKASLFQENSSSTNTTQADSNKSSRPTESSSKKEEEVVWTKEEQAALEEGLKKYSSKEKERWQMIADLVKTKTKKQCIKRYKELVEKLKKK